MHEFFLADVASGLDWKDTDGSTDLTSADAGDVARFDGTDWVKQGNIRGPCRRGWRGWRWTVVLRAVLELSQR